MPGRLAHRVAVVTGAGSGIGLETAALFASEGASVIAADINYETASKTAELIKTQFHGIATPCKADVSSEADVEAMCKLAVDTYGRLDIMFNNAGIMHPDDSDAVGTSEKIFDLTYNINVKGVWYGCKHAILAMKKNPTDETKGLTAGGSIVNTASFVGLMGAATPQLAYTASKGAVLALTRELATVHAREGIRINSLCPGPIRTPLLMDFLNTAEKKERRLVHVPMGRFGEANEMAKAVIFLASPESSFVTGLDMKVDGGLTSAYVTPQGEPLLAPPKNMAAP